MGKATQVAAAGGGGKYVWCGHSKEAHVSIGQEEDRGGSKGTVEEGEGQRCINQVSLKPASSSRSQDASTT